jgi:hypothetical protein
MMQVYTWYSFESDENIICFEIDSKFIFTKSCGENQQCLQDVPQFRLF